MAYETLIGKNRVRLENLLKNVNGMLENSSSDIICLMRCSILLGEIHEIVHLMDEMGANELLNYKRQLTTLYDGLEKRYKCLPLEVY